MYTPGLVPVGYSAQFTHEELTKVSNFLKLPKFDRIEYNKTLTFGVGNNNNLILDSSGTGTRIQGDFSNATIPNRTAFKSSTSNGNTFAEIIPNGTATVSGIVAETDSALINSSAFSFVANGGNDARITSTIRGSGTQLPITFYIGASEAMRIDPSRNVVINTAALATTATDGFLYIPTCAGTPTGTPTAYTGRVPLVYDSTNNKLMIYTGGVWKGATFL